MYYTITFITDINTAETPEEALKMVIDDIKKDEELYWEVEDAKGNKVGITWPIK